MKIEVTDGLGIITIGNAGIGSYFKLQKPVSVVWDDCGGSVAQYMCLLPYDKEYREQVLGEISACLYEDFTDREEDLYNALKPLLRLFPNGDYFLDFYNGIDESNFRSLDVKMDYYPDWFIAIPEHVTKINESEEIKYGYYDGYDDAVIATRSLEEINPERVKFYEEEIKSGKRPFALILNYNFYDFILDGHHKLLAYKNLRVEPPIATIDLTNQKNLECDFEYLVENMQPWQIEHILKNWDTRDVELAEKLKNPDSVLHLYIKNGHCKLYHTGGQLVKSEAFYINDKVEGLYKEWYTNGQLKSEHYYNKGKRCCTWKDWHVNGQLSFVQNFNENGLNDGLLISYFENGQQRMKQLFANGKNADGLSYENWYEDGIKEAEVVYKDGYMIERKNFGRDGKLINHEVWDSETKTLKKLPILQGAKTKVVQPVISIKKEEYKSIIPGIIFLIKVWIITALVVLIITYLITIL